jgi:hypothetical protein
MDEVHFQQHGSRCRMWVPPEVDDPVCLHAPTRKSISFFGAVRLQDGKLVMSRPEGMFDAHTCWDFLRHHANLHAAWREEVADHFQLHFLPPYSPELNPIERVWKLIRRCCLHNHYFPTLEGVLTAIAPRLQAWSRPNTTLRRLCGIV